MERTRLIEYSLYYKIQDKLSRRRKKEKPKTLDSQTYNLRSVDVLPQYPVEVFVNNIQQQGNFTVNYLDGIVTFDFPLNTTDTVEISYTYCTHTIYDESNNPRVEEFVSPAVAIHRQNRTDKAFELGNAEREEHSMWVIDVWSYRGGERHDATDMLTRMFEVESLPIVDYNLGFPLEQNGTKNDNFDTRSMTTNYMILDGIKSSDGGSLYNGDKPVYTSNIVVDLIINP